MKAEKPRVSDEVIKARVEQNGCEFISSRRERDGKTRIHVKYYCPCDKDAEVRKIHESKWDVITGGGKCADCGNKRRKESNIKTYAERGEEIQQKIENTMLQRHGATNPMQAPEIKAKIEKTCMERYGTTNPLENVEIRQKIKDTMLEKYGVECALQAPSIIEKREQTCLERYGVKHAVQSDIVKEKIK